MNAHDLVNLGLIVLIWSIALGALCHKLAWKSGYRAGRVDERGCSAAKILNAKREGALAERQRLSPSTTSKN